MESIVLNSWKEVIEHIDNGWQPQPVILNIVQHGNYYPTCF